MGDVRATVLAFLDAEGNSMARHARMVAESHGEKDKAVTLCRYRASVFKAAASLIRGQAPPPLAASPKYPYGRPPQTEAPTPAAREGARGD